MFWIGDENHVDDIPIFHLLLSTAYTEPGLCFSHCSTIKEAGGGQEAGRGCSQDIYPADHRDIPYHMM